MSLAEPRFNHSCAVALFHARLQVSVRRSSSLEPEHLLLALLRTERKLIARHLKNGWTVARLQAVTKARLVPEGPDKVPHDVEVPLADVTSSSSLQLGISRPSEAAPSSARCTCWPRWFRTMPLRWDNCCGSPDCRPSRCSASTEATRPLTGHVESRSRYQTWTSCRRGGPQSYSVGPVRFWQLSSLSLASPDVGLHGWSQRRFCSFPSRSTCCSPPGSGGVSFCPPCRCLRLERCRAVLHESPGRPSSPSSRS